MRRHRQARQVRHRDALVQGHRDRQGADRGRLVDDQQHRPVLAKPPVQLAELGLVVGQRPVQQLLTRPALGDGVVLALADVQPQEHSELIVPVDHEHLRPFRPVAAADLPDQRAASLGIHVTVGLAHEFGRSSPYKRSPATHRDQRQHPQRSG